MQKLSAIHNYLTELRNGKIRAFEKLFALYYPRLFKYAFHFLQNSFEAEDLVQEVFIEVWKRRKIFDNENHFSSYLFTALRNKCLNLLKRRVTEENYLATQAHLASEELYHISFGVDDGFISMEKKLTRVIEEVISEMPDRCGEAFRLKWLEGKKIREIAEMMKISTTMVDKHLAKGLEIARKKMSSNLVFFFICLKEKER